MRIEDTPLAGRHDSRPAVFLHNPIAAVVHRSGKRVASSALPGRNCMRRAGAHETYYPGRDIAERFWRLNPRSISRLDIDPVGGIGCPSIAHMVMQLGGRFGSPLGSRECLPSRAREDGIGLRNRRGGESARSLTSHHDFRYFAAGVVEVWHPVGATSAGNWEVPPMAGVLG